MRRLAFFLACIAVLAPEATAQRPAPETADSTRITTSGVLYLNLIDADGRRPTYRYDVRSDSTVEISYVGVVEPMRAPIPGAPLPTMPSAPDSAPRVRLPVKQLKTIVETAAIDTLPELRGDGFAYSESQDEMLVAFRQSVPRATAAAIVLGLLGVAATIAAALVVRRSRRRREADLAMRKRRQAATEAERARLARELHDGPLQDLHALRLRAASGDVETIENATGDLAKEIRAIAEGLRPPALGRFGLGAALASHAARISERHPGVRVRIHAQDNLPPLAPEAEASLFRVAQEAIQNAIRHGEAQRVDIDLAVGPERGAPNVLTLRVQDDGSGLPAAFEANRASLPARGHFGLAGMEERAALLRGSLLVHPRRDGPGTSLLLTAPWRAVRAPEPTPHASGALA